MNVRQARILLCEDEALVALDLCYQIEDMGHSVIGPCARVAQALELCETAEIDAAILDVRLADGEVFPLAERLQRAGVGIIFHSGHALPEHISANFPDAVLCSKPTSAAHLTQALKALLGEVSTQPG